MTFTASRKHLLPGGNRGPVLAGNMLVEIFTGADTEKEPVAEHVGHRRGRLGNNHRMGPDERAGDACPNLECAGDLGDAAQRAPDKRTLPLAVEPGMKMV